MGALLQNGGRAICTNDGVLVETPLSGLCLQNRELSLLIFSLTHSSSISKYRSDVLSCTSQEEQCAFKEYFAIILFHLRLCLLRPLSFTISVIQFISMLMISSNKGIFEV